MKCVFKDEGFPSNYSFSCGPLVKIYLNSGLSNGKAKQAARNVIAAYSAIKSDDIIRDSSSENRKRKAGFSRKIQAGFLSKELNEYIKKINKDIEYLEKTGSDMKTYMEYVSKAGGDVFVKAAPYSGFDEDFVRKSGMTVSTLITLNDMNSDKEMDSKKRSYNPWKESFGNFYNEVKRKFSELMEEAKIEKNISTDTEANAACCCYYLLCCQDEDEEDE